MKSLKARAVMIDMEERVINCVMQGPLRDLFEHTQTVTDVSGSGNNWAVGEFKLVYSLQLMIEFTKKLKNRN